MLTISCRELTICGRVWACKYKSPTCLHKTSSSWHHNSNKLLHRLRHRHRGTLEIRRTMGLVEYQGVTLMQKMVNLPEMMGLFVPQCSQILPRLSLSFQCLNSTISPLGSSPCYPIIDCLLFKQFAFSLHIAS